VLGIPTEESTLAQRVQAFVSFAGSGEAAQGEFAVFAEAVRRPQLSAPWLAWLRTWFAFDEGTDSAPSCSCGWPRTACGSPRPRTPPP
jgi:hypothetical protein